MTNLIIILLLVFGSVALMVKLGERFAKPADSEKMDKLGRWIVPLVGFALVASIASYYLR